MQTTMPPALQQRLLAQGLTCQLLLPEGAAETDIKEVIIYQAGPGSGFTPHTADLYRDILDRGDTAVLMYTPWSGRFGKSGAIEELDIITRAVLDVYGHIDLGIVASSGGQKIILEAAVAGVFNGVHKCVFINGALEARWSRYSSSEEKLLLAEQNKKDASLQLKPSSIKLACDPDQQTSLWRRLSMKALNWLAGLTPDYAFENRGFYLSPAFLASHSAQEIYDTLREHYTANAAVLLVYGNSKSFYWQDQTKALEVFAKTGVNFLVVSGTEDCTVDPKQSQKTVAAIQRVSGAVRKVDLPVGHMADVEDPEGVRRALNDFFISRSVLQDNDPSLRHPHG